MKTKVLTMPTKDIAKPQTQAIVIKHHSKKLTSKERRNLRNAAYEQIRHNSPGVSKGLVKHVAFLRSKAGFAAIEALQVCAGKCGHTLLKSNLDCITGLCENCAKLVTG